jgi:ppGpp synthetase/RelA/SpoT-type nucleotidyltranferase
MVSLYSNTHFPFYPGQVMPQSPLSEPSSAGNHPGALASSLPAAKLPAAASLALYFGVKHPTVPRPNFDMSELSPEARARVELIWQANAKMEGLKGTVLSYVSEMLHLPDDTNIVPLQRRVKSPESMAQKLSRYLTNGKIAPETANTAEGVLWGLGDGIGLRGVISGNIEEGFDNVITALSERAKQGEIVITEIENYNGGYPYMDFDTGKRQGHIYKLASADAIGRTKVRGAEAFPRLKITNAKEATKPSGFTEVQIKFLIPEIGLNTPIELQLRGVFVNLVAEVEHVFYEVEQAKMAGGKSLNDKVKKRLGDRYFENLYAAMQALNSGQRAALNEYKTEFYQHARLIEQGQRSTPPRRPPDLPEVLDMNYLADKMFNIKDAPAERAMAAEIFDLSRSR